MPFIDDALLWCPDNDGRLVGGLDLGTCIAVSTRTYLRKFKSSIEIERYGGDIFIPMKWTWTLNDFYIICTSN